MNREKAIRYKIYQILTGTDIEYDSGLISVWDEKAEDNTNNIYILFRDQSAQRSTTFCDDSWECTFELAIVNKQPDTISKDSTDDVSEQVEDLLNAGLIDGVEYEGWQFNNFALDNTNYSGLILTDTGSEIEKTMTFTLTATKLS